MASCRHQVKEGRNSGRVWRALLSSSLSEDEASKQASKQTTLLSSCSTALGGGCPMAAMRSYERVQ